MSGCLLIHNSNQEVPVEKLAWIRPALRITAGTKTNKTWSLPSKCSESHRSGSYGNGHILKGSMRNTRTKTSIQSMNRKSANILLEGTEDFWEKVKKPWQGCQEWKTARLHSRKIKEVFGEWTRYVADTKEVQGTFVVFKWLTFKGTRCFYETKQFKAEPR